MPSKFIWDNLPGIELFDILKTPDTHLVYSCFNYNPMSPDNHLKCSATQLKIYYTGERFLYETNADVIIGFFPNKDYITECLNTYKNDAVEQKRILSYPVEIVNVLMGYTNSAMANVPVADIMATNKLFIVIRDQERGMLEYLYKKGSWIPGDNISIYTELNLSWTRVQFGLKTRFCCFIVSNPCCWQRNNFFELLSKYKPVDSLGRYKPRLPVDITHVPARENQDEYFGLLAQYKFMITFENNSLAWYNTEKIFNAFQAGTVPIYWGDPLIHMVYNPECFVWVKTHQTMVNQYTEFKTAIDYIKRLDTDDELYMSLFKENTKSLMVNASKEDARLFKSIQTLLFLQ
jgi:hypothetical protein